jgi:ABC transport system ATP-binding/permease protein
MIPMALINLQNIDVGVGGPLLLENVTISVEAGERIALIGRNGAGKSTLLKVINREWKPDDGEVRYQEGVRVARMEQEVPGHLSGSIFSVVADGLGDIGQWLSRYHELSIAPDVDTNALADVQHKIEVANAWDSERRVSETLTRLNLEPDLAFAGLSGGMKRRVLLARGLVSAPDVLLLDEPTNHLDIEAIEQLETILREWRGCLIFITHDRRFLRSLANRIIEIDRGSVTSWPGDFDNYLRRREERLHAESQENARFDKLLAQEEVWIRQGIKARRTRDEGRVRRLEAMRRERAQRRELTGKVNIGLAESENSGKKVLELKNIHFGYGDKTLIKDFSTTVMRGDRIGLLGPNGVGKSSLIKLLLGDLKPISGEIKHGTQLQVAYFDQYRLTLREDWNAIDNVAEGREFIEVDGKRKHVLGYLQDFLFTPDRARASIDKLSGGERNRLLLAKLFAKPSNFLIMDEPTNDLDVETLELLEEILGDYPGTLLLVSHDREFIDRVVSACWVMEGEGRVAEYVGGYSDWLRQRPVKSEQKAIAASKTVTVEAVEKTAKKKLSYKDARELEQLPALIETLETEIAERTEAMHRPDFYQQGSAVINAANAELAEKQTRLDSAYARWEALEALK